MKNFMLTNIYGTEDCLHFNSGWKLSGNSTINWQLAIN